MAVHMYVEIRSRIRTRIISLLSLNSNRESARIVHNLPHSGQYFTENKLSEGKQLKCVFLT
jgi:hypothetical protein